MCTIDTNRRKRAGAQTSLDADATARAAMHRDLLENELRYVNGLHVLLSEYLNPLRTTKRALVGKEREIEPLVDMLSDILAINRRFLELLQQAVDDAAQAGGACFAEAFSIAIPKFRVYAEYATKWTQSLAVLTKLKKSKPFVNFIAAVDASPASGGVTFDNLLATPLARMAYYESVLAKLPSLTPDPDERARLAVAYQQMRQLQSYFGEVNNLKFHRETLAKALARIRDCDHDLLSDERQYLYEGPLRVGTLEYVGASAGLTQLLLLFFVVVFDVI